LTYGYYYVAGLWLRKNKPSLVVLANDHNMPNRVIQVVSKKLNIPTFYLQHGSITNKFPKLNFDYAMLDGVVSLRKYEEAGQSQTKVFLGGMPKMDILIKKTPSNEQRRREIKSIGVCINKLDPTSRIDELIKSLRNYFPEQDIHLRPHPGGDQKKWKQIAEDNYLDFSNSKHEDPLTFLQKVDVIIAGSSTIILEAIIMNKYAVFYDFAKKGDDPYGYHKWGLVNYTSEPFEVIDELENISDEIPRVRDKGIMFCDTLETSMEGRSTELASDLIMRFIGEHKINPNIWVRYRDSSLETYRLNEKRS
jgi:hypothetical protein